MRMHELPFFFFKKNFVIVRVNEARNLGKIRRELFLHVESKQRFVPSYQFCPEKKKVEYLTKLLNILL